MCLGTLEIDRDELPDVKTMPQLAHLAHELGAARYATDPRFCQALGEDLWGSLLGFFGEFWRSWVFSWNSRLIAHNSKF